MNHPNIDIKETTTTTILTVLGTVVHNHIYTEKIGLTLA